MSKLPITPSDLFEIANGLNHFIDRLNCIRDTLKEAACSHCDGTGLRYDNHFTTARHPCSVCGGSGFQKEAGK